MKKLLTTSIIIAVFVLSVGAALAAPWMQVNGVSGDYATFHYYIDESEGETDSVLVEFWPNEGNIETVELWSNLNHRDLATLYPPDPATVHAGDVEYFSAYTMTGDGTGRYYLTMPIEKCGAYRITCRYKVNGDGAWRWYTGRDTAVVISDVATRDMIMMEVQVNAVDATGDGWDNRSTFADLHDGSRFDLDYVKALGVNTLWLMPFHPIGSRADGNYGEAGSPYSIKNMWKVGEHLGRDGTREGAMAEFKAFMADAEAKGVNILFDTIFNHTAKDAEMERDPSNPAFLAANPLEEIRNVKPNWYSRYTGDGSCSWTTDPGGSPPYEYWAPAENAWQVGPAPADRHDFGKWCDTIDLFWGGYSALGNPFNEDDGLWDASDEVKKMTEYFAYFTQYWLEQTDWAIDGFRCDFAQGLPPQAWEYIINKSKSQKPELAFMAESLDGGAVSRRAGRHFDVINESWVWGVLGNGDTTSGLRGIIDARKADYGFAGVLRGLINHDQNAPGDKWWTLSRYAVGCAIDGAPQMFMGQELGYTDNWGFSKFRFEFGRYVPDIRQYYSMEPLWNDTSWDHDALWARYAEVNRARERAEVIRLANQYYLDQVNGWGTHEQIFSVMKYADYGWDPADQEVVLCFVNLDPFAANSGTFDINVPAVYLDPNKSYNVRNLASSDPDAYLWPEARSGSDLAANGIFVGFSGNVFDEGAVAQFLKLEELGSQPQPLWVGHTSNWPSQGELDEGEALWVDTETWPVEEGQAVTLHYRVDGGAWQSTSMAFNFHDNNTHWHVNLGSFPAGQAVEYYTEAADADETVIDNNGGANFVVTVNGDNGGNVEWIGNTYNWPFAGDINARDDLWINCETYPQGAAAETRVVYSVDGAAWQEAVMEPNGVAGNNDVWHLNLGRFSEGTTIEYVVEAEDDAGALLADDNGGVYYRATVNTAPHIPLEWAGNTYHWPLNGQIDAGETLWVNIDSYPRQAATEARVVYSVNGGAWQTAPMSLGDPAGNNDHWYVDLGTYASGDHIQYAVEVVDGLGHSLWDNNGGGDFHAGVN